MTRQSHASPKANLPVDFGVSRAGSTTAQTAMTVESTASSMHSVIQPKRKTHSPTAGAVDTAAMLDNPHHANPCARRDSGMNSLMIAEAEARMPDQIEP